MLKRNDGKGINAVQNKFTALLKTALRNRRIDYILLQKKHDIEVPFDEYKVASETYDFIQAIVDFDVVKSALKTLSERERKIILAHIIEDRDFADIGREYGLTYKGAATVFYRAMAKLREVLERYRDEF